MSTWFGGAWARFTKHVGLIQSVADPEIGQNMKAGANDGLLVEIPDDASLPLPTRAAVDKALRSANHTLHDSTVCTAGAVGFSVDTAGTYTYRLKNDTGDVTAYFAAGVLNAMEPKLIKSTGSPGGAKATLYFLT